MQLENLFTCSETAAEGNSNQQRFCIYVYTPNIFVFPWHLFQPKDPKSQGSFPHHQDEIKHQLCASSITRESLGQEANDNFSRINGRGKGRGNFRWAESNELESGQDTEVLSPHLVKNAVGSLTIN